MRSSLVLLGELSGRGDPLDFFAAKHGWTLECVCSFDALEALSNERDVVGVLFCPRNLAMPWENALKLVVKAAPKALPIICHGFAEIVPWAEAAAAGAFLTLWLPLHPDEVKQCLGFVAERLSCRGPHLLIDSKNQNRINPSNTRDVATDRRGSDNLGRKSLKRGAA